MTFLDIGANCGEFTVFAAKRLPQGKVYAFEPVTRHVEKLKRNLELNNFRNVQIVQRGLSNKRGEAKIYGQEAPFLDGTFHRGLETLYPFDKRQNFIEIIPLLPLDEFVEQQGIHAVHVIKIDVEGAELSVLKSAQKTLESNMPILFVELSRATCEAAGYEVENRLSYLTELGYEYKTIGKDGTTQNLLADFVQDFQNIFCYPIGPK